MKTKQWLWVLVAVVGIGAGVERYHATWYVDRVKPSDVVVVYRPGINADRVVLLTNFLESLKDQTNWNAPTDAELSAARTNSVVPGSDLSVALQNNQVVVNADLARKLVLSDPNAFDPTVWLWRNWITNSGGYQAHEQIVLVPSGDRLYTGYHLRTNSVSLVPTMAGITVGMPMYCINHTNGATTGAGWSTVNAVYAFGGSYRKTVASNDTISITVTGSVVALTIPRLTVGGLALVAVDGDYSAANLMPKVTAAMTNNSPFTPAELGMAYYDCYGPSLFEEWVPVAKDLRDEPHVITVKATGLHSAGADYRVWVAAVCAWRPGVGLGGTDVRYAQLWDVFNSRLGGSSFLSAVGSVCRLTPTGGTSEWLGEYHRNEHLDSYTIKVDGVATNLAQDTYTSGNKVVVDRWTTLTNTTAGAVGSKHSTLVFSAAGSDQFNWHNSYLWHTNGNVTGYAGMLPLVSSILPLGQTALGQTNMFTVFRNGAVLNERPATLAGDTNYAASTSDWMSAWGTNHNLVVTMWVKSLESVQSLQQTNKSCFWYNGVDGMDKGYFLGWKNSEAVTSGQMDQMSCSLAVREIKFADRVLRPNGIAGW